MNTYQKTFIKKYLFDNLDNIDLSTVAPDDSQEPYITSFVNSVWSRVLSSAKAPLPTGPNKVILTKFIEDESTKTIIRNIKLMKLMGQIYYKLI